MPTFLRIKHHLDDIRSSIKHKCMESESKPDAGGNAEKDPVAHIEGLCVEKMVILIKGVPLGVSRRFPEESSRD